MAAAPGASGGALAANVVRRSANLVSGNFMSKSMINAQRTPSNFRCPRLVDLLNEIFTDAPQTLGVQKKKELELMADKEAMSALKVLQEYRNQRRKAGEDDDAIRVVLHDQHCPDYGLRMSAIRPSQSESAKKRLIHSLTHAVKQPCTYAPDFGFRFPSAATAVGPNLFRSGECMNAMLRSLDMCSHVCDHVAAQFEMCAIQHIIALDANDDALPLRILGMIGLGRRTTVWDEKTVADLSHMKNPIMLVVKSYEGSIEGDDTGRVSNGLLALPQLGISTRIGPPQHRMLLMAAVTDDGQLYAVAFDPTYAQFNAAAVLEEGAKIAAQCGESSYKPWWGAARAFKINAPPYDPVDLALKAADEDGPISTVVQWWQQQQKLRATHKTGPKVINLDGFSYGFLGDYVAADGRESVAATMPRYILHGLKTKRLNGVVGTVHQRVTGTDGIERVVFIPEDNAAGIKIKPQNLKLVDTAPPSAAGPDDVAAGEAISVAHATRKRP